MECEAVVCYCSLGCGVKVRKMDMDEHQACVLVVFVACANAPNFRREPVPAFCLDNRVTSVSSNEPCRATNSETNGCTTS